MKTVALASAFLVAAGVSAGAAGSRGGEVPPPSSLTALKPRLAEGQTRGGRRFEPPRGRTCFNQAETRDSIALFRLAQPFRALHAGRLQGEALRARLCRWKPDEFVYEISVLRRDGRIVHVYMNARNGQTVGALNDAERK